MPDNNTPDPEPGWDALTLILLPITWYHTAKQWVCNKIRHQDGE